MGRRRHAPAPPSPLADALARVGDRWTLLLVAALLEGEKRFNELQEELDGIAPNVLSARLKLLVEQALVVARPYSERPPRFVYELGASWPARCGCSPTGARAATERASRSATLHAAPHWRRAGGARAARRSRTTPPTRATSSTSEHGGRRLRRRSPV